MPVTHQEINAIKEYEIDLVHLVHLHQQATRPFDDGIRLLRILQIDSCDLGFLVGRQVKFRFHERGLHPQWCVESSELFDRGEECELFVRYFTL